KIDRVPRAPAPALACGIALHAAIEDDCRASIEARPYLSSAALFLTFLERLESELATSDPTGCIQASQRMALAERGLAMLRGYWREVRPEMEPVAVEEEFVVPIDGLGDHWTFVGRKDLRTVRTLPDGRRQRETIDFKSAGRHWDERKLVEAREQAL